MAITHAGETFRGLRIPKSSPKGKKSWDTQGVLRLKKCVHVLVSWKSQERVLKNLMCMMCRSRKKHLTTEWNNNGYSCWSTADSGFWIAVHPTDRSPGARARGVFRDPSLRRRSCTDHWFFSKRSGVVGRPWVNNRCSRLDNPQRGVWLKRSNFGHLLRAASTPKPS